MNLEINSFTGPLCPGIPGPHSTGIVAHFAQEWLAHFGQEYPPEPEKMLGYQKDLLAKIKEKSFSNLYKSSNSCEIRIENEVLEIHPNTYFDRNKPQQGLVWVKNIAFEYKLPSASKEEIASKVLELLKTDYKNIESFKSI